MTWLSGYFDSKAGEGRSATCTDVQLPAAFETLVPLQKEVMTFEMARAPSHERTHHRERLSTRLNSLLDEGMAISGAIFQSQRQQ